MTQRLLALNYIGANPIKAMKFCIWFIQTLFGFMILSPWFMPEATPALQQGLNSIVAIKIYGALMFFPGLVALVLLLRNKAQSARQRLMFWSFLIFSYLTMLRIAVFGPLESLVWMAYALNALTAGIIHLRIKWENI